MQGQANREYPDGKYSESSESRFAETQEAAEWMRESKLADSARLTGNASRVLVRRAQLAVRNEVMAGEDRRRKGRGAVGLATLVFAFLLLLLTPAVWTGFNQWVSWVHFADAEGQSLYLMLWLLPAALALLVAALVRQQFSNGQKD